MLASLPEQDRQRFLDSLSPSELLELEYHWPFWARPQQLAPPGDWRTWLVLAGRGFGKTRTGAEYIRQGVESGQCGNIALVAATAGDARDVMVEGPGSGLLAVCPPNNRPIYEPSKRKVTWPNGAVAHLYSADEPDRLRGPQHDRAWADEIASWAYVEAWDNLMFGLRIGADPRTVVTTTPRPIPLLKDLIKQKTTVVTGGNTYENFANLAPAFIEQIISKYEGTRLGRQELYAEILDDVEGALWTRQMLDDLRVLKHPDLKRIVVAVDPEATSTEGSAETGIVVVGLGVDDHGYLLDDLSLRDTPDRWGRAVVTALNMHGADRVVAEANQGGEMVEHVLRTIMPNIPYKAVHASRSKVARAEPIAALTEQGRIHHVGMFGPLEDQLCGWVVGEKSPDRLDAYVWGFTELMVEQAEPTRTAPPTILSARTR